MAEKEYYKVNLKLSEHSRDYSREVPELIEVIDGIGGFVGFVFIFGSLCTTFLTKRQFEAALISETYQV